MCQSWLSRVLSDVCLLLITNTVCITLWPLAWIMWRYQKYSHHGNSFTMITRLGGKDWPGKRSAPHWWCFGGEWSMTCWPTTTQNAMSLKGDDWTPWLRAAFPYSSWCRASNCGYPALWRCKSVLQDTLVPTPPEIPLVSSVGLLLLRDSCIGRAYHQHWGIPAKSPDVSAFTKANAKFNTQLVFLAFLYCPLNLV